VSLIHVNRGKSPGDPQWTEDGMHLMGGGYWMVSFQVQLGLGHLSLWRFDSPQFDTLRAAILKKNELFFQRWRPEN